MNYFVLFLYLPLLFDFGLMTRTMQKIEDGSKKIFKGVA